MLEPTTFFMGMLGYNMIYVIVDSVEWEQDWLLSALSIIIYDYLSWSIIIYDHL